MGICPNKSKQLSRINFSNIPLIPHTLAESTSPCASPLCGIEKTSRTDPAQIGVDPAQTDPFVSVGSQNSQDMRPRTRLIGMSINRDKDVSVTIYHQIAINS